MLRGSMSQIEFAKKIDCVQTSYSGWETGNREPSASAIAKICSSCSVTSDWLIGLNKKMEDTSNAYVLEKKLASAKKAFFRLNEAVKELENAL